MCAWCAVCAGGRAAAARRCGVEVACRAVFRAPRQLAARSEVRRVSVLLLRGGLAVWRAHCRTPSIFKKEFKKNRKKTDPYRMDSSSCSAAACGSEPCAWPAHMAMSGPR